MRKSKTVGILGGMGPYATVSFYQMILEMTPVDKDWDHLRIIMDVNPHIPSRSRHHLFKEASPVPGMIKSCQRLEAFPVDFIVIPCNSASFYLPHVQAAIKIPLLNIMQVTADALREQLPSVRRVAVVGGVVTYDNCTYEPFLKHHGIEYVHHSNLIQRRIEQLIESIKSNISKEDAIAQFRILMRDICKECDIDAIILGCTEFGCLGKITVEVPLLDSSLQLARATVKMALS